MGGVQCALSHRATDLQFRPGMQSCDRIREGGFGCDWVVFVDFSSFLLKMGC